MRRFTTAQIIVAFVFLFGLQTPVYAASVFTINNAPASILENQEFQVLVNLTVGGSAGKTYYLRADFYKAGTTGYFGYTKNKDTNEWYNPKLDFDYTKLYKIQMLPDNTWSGVVEIKPDSAAPGYKGSGDYYLKVRRYTSATGYEWSDPVKIAITGDSTGASPSPSATPTPSSSPSPSPTPLPSSTPSPSPSISPSPKVSSSPKPSPKPSPSPTVTPTKSPSPSPQEQKELVLGVQESSPEGTLENVAKEASSEGQGKTLFAGFLNKNALLPAGLIGVGLVLLFFSIYSLFKRSSSVRITGEDKQSLFSSERENEKF